MTNTYHFAKSEIDALIASGLETGENFIVEEFRDEILDLCEKFGLSGQSGGSAPFAAGQVVSVIRKLLLQQPISPILGVDSEWVTVGVDDPRNGSGFDIRQNIRCSALFQHGDDPAHYLDAIAWKTQTGSIWSGSAIFKGETFDSHQYVKRFPFTPKTFYVDVTEVEVAKDDWSFYVNDERQLKKVFKYYDKFTTPFSRK